MLEELDLSAEALRSIQAPTMLMAGEFDLIRDDQTEAMHRLIPGSRKYIVPGEAIVFSWMIRKCWNVLRKNSIQVCDFRSVSGGASGKLC